MQTRYFLHLLKRNIATLDLMPQPRPLPIMNGNCADALAAFATSAESTNMNVSCPAAKITRINFHVAARLLTRSNASCGRRNVAAQTVCLLVGSANGLRAHQ